MRICDFPLSLGTGSLGTDLQGDGADRLLDAYAEAGGDLLDTAHVYACWVPGGTGASERAVGDWLRRRGTPMKVATKGGHPPMDGYPHPEDFLAPESIARDVAESLDRLGRDHIDLYYLHRDDGKTPVEEIIDALSAQGSLRQLGASNWSIARVAEANAYAARVGKKGFVALQNQWSLAVPIWRPTSDPTVRFIEDADRDWCAANGVAVHAYSSTANGYFAHGGDDGPFVGNAARRERARELAARLGKTPNQIALAWLLNQSGHVVPILGTTKVAHLQDALGAIGVQIDAETREWLRG